MAGKQRVAINPELRQRLDDLLGANSHRLIFTKPKVNKNSNGDTFRRRSSN
jgi:hypothetical protein